MRFPSVPRKKTAPRTNEGAPVPEGPWGLRLFLFTVSSYSWKAGVLYFFCPYSNNLPVRQPALEVLMMLKRLLALGLSCTLLFSLTVPASAARVGSSQPKPTASQSQPVTPAQGTVSFDQLGDLIRTGNLTVLALQETITSMEAMDWDDAIGQMESAISQMEEQMAQLTGTSCAELEAACKKLAASLADLDCSLDSLKSMEVLQDLAALGEASAALIYGQLQLKALESALTSMQAQLEELKQQQEEYAKTLADTKRQITYTIQQLIAGAESLYVTILSTQLQLDTLKDTEAAMGRTVAEMELRYARGQISKLTLTQVQNGATTLSANIENLENTLTTMKASLQSMLGLSPTGKLILVTPPAVTDAQLNAIRYDQDLKKAKENSYDLYTARRTVEDAQEDMEDALESSGAASYQYAMAQHTYQSALYQQQAAVQSFELSFQSLYRALSPARSAVKAAEDDLAYQEQVYAASQLKYQQGNLSRNALLDARDTLESTRRDLTSAQLDLFTAYRSYQNAVNFGLVSSGNQ